MRHDEHVFGTPADPPQRSDRATAFANPAGIERFRVYKDSTSDGSYERLEIGTDGTDMVIDTQAGPGGGTARNVITKVGGTQAQKLGAAGVVLPQTYDAGNGRTVTYQSATEDITLSLVAAHTDSSASLLPANAVIEAVIGEVLTTITGATDWDLADPTTAARFAAANATLTAGTKSIGLAHLSGAVGTLAAGPTQTAAAKIRINTTGTPTAGKIRVTVIAKVYA